MLLNFSFKREMPVRSRRVRSRRGFSLVISLVMMAMMLLVAISLVSFVYVQSRLTEGKLKHFQAQNNAISGMRMALGQLQLLSGDDQRVTATADLLSSQNNDSLPKGQAVQGKRFWTGVWATGGLNKTKIRDWSVYSPDTKPFLGWLVSDYDSSLEVYSPNEYPVNRDTVSKNSQTLLKVAQTDFDTTLSDTEIVTLVGAGTLGSEADNESRTLKQREVRVRRVPLTTYSAASSEPIRNTSGSFAYWVGDEGVKAKLNVPDGTDPAFVGNNGDWIRRVSNVVAQRNSPAVVDGLSQFGSWWSKDVEGANDRVSATILPYVGGTNSLALYPVAVSGGSTDSTLKNSAQKLFHDVSFVSKGVFSDVYNGGLKTDLSIAFEMPWFSEGSWKKGFRDIEQFHGSNEVNEMNLKSYCSLPSDEEWWTDQPSDGLGYLYEISTNETTRNSTTEMEYLRGPTWDLVRNYYRMYKREDEEKGFRGFKPTHDDSWIAIGSRPYTFISGTTSSGAVKASDGSNGWLGAKYNYSLVSCRHTLSQYNSRNALLPEFNGKSHSQPGGTSYSLTVPQAMRIAPVVRRIVIRCSIIMNQDTSVICFDPIIVIHNPYNVPIEFFGFGTIWTKFFPFDFDLVRTDIDESTAKTKYWPNTSSSTLTFKGADLFGTNAWDWRLFSRVFAGTTDFNTSPSGAIRMLPGEVKVMYPKSAMTTSDIHSVGSANVSKTVGSLCDFEFEQNSAATVDLGISVSELAKDTTNGSSNLRFYVKVRPIESTSSSSSYYCDVEMMPFYLHYPLSSAGASLANSNGLVRSWGNAATSMKDVADTSDYDFTQIVTYRRYFPNDGSEIKSDDLSQSSETGIASAEKQYFVYIDVRNLSAENSPLAAPLVSNARPWAIDPRSWDGDLSERNVGVGWTRTVEQDGAMCPVESKSKSGYWGDDLGASGGQTNIVLFQIPQTPLLSLGQLQHVECSVLDMEPSYVIGNSYPSIGFKTSELADLLVWPDATATNDRYSSSHSPQPRGDLPFAANLQLFDHYFFSGVNFGDTDSAQEDDMDKFIEKVFSTTEESPFPNKRVSLIRDFGDRTETEVKKDFYDPEKVARDLLFDGSFNINSTSVEAWRAVLSSLRGKTLEVDGKDEEISGATPIVRFASMIGSKLGGFGSVVDNDGDEGSGWRWFCKLTDSEIKSLAENIVDQVRVRGPFMSLSDFVNRRLSTGTTGKAGALQMAIDQSNINTSRRNGFADSDVSNPNSTSYPSLFSTDFKAKKKGVPGYLSQGDLLSALAPGLSARTDTFTIRAYGDLSGVTGMPEARAWCEAVVQRVPEFFDPEDDDSDGNIVDSVKFLTKYRSSQPSLGQPDIAVLEKFKRNDDLSAVNKLFGRRYKIISFRWLSQNEI